MKIKYIVIFIISLLFAPKIYSQNKFSVVIDAGHGGHDPGCIGQKKTKEKDINLSVALKLGALIEKNCKDVKVIYTRKTDVFVPLIKRAQVANNNKSELFISIHCDAVANKNSAASAYGVSTFTMGAAKTEANLAVAQRENSVILMEENYETTYQGFDPKSPESYIMFELLQGTHQKHSLEFAQCIQKEIKDRAKRNDRSVRQTPALVLKEAGMPAVLIEIGFLSNLKEEAYLVTQSGQNTIANSIYHGFVEYKKMYDKQNMISDAKSIVDTDTEANAKAATTVKEKPAEVKPVAVKQVSNTEKTEVKKQPEIKQNSVTNATSQKPATVKTTKEEIPLNAIKEEKELTYKIQFFTSSTLFKSDATQFRGLKNVEYYKDGDIYKYTVGNGKSSDDLINEMKVVKQKFKDAFIVKFRDGKRVK